MKLYNINKVAWIAILCVFSYSCKSLSRHSQNFQNAHDGYENIDGIAIPCITKDKMIFRDTRRFKRARGKRGNHQQYTLVENEMLGENIAPIRRVYKFNEEGIELITETYSMKSPITNDLLYSENFIYNVYLGYYPGGNIKYYAVFMDAKGITEYKAGTWYQYDTNGQIIKRIAHDEIFKTSLASILKLRNEFIRKELQANGNRLNITFERILKYKDAEGRAEWTIVFYDELARKRKLLIIDDDNGTVKEVRDMKFPSDNHVLDGDSSNPYKGYFIYE